MRKYFLYKTVRIIRCFAAVAAAVALCTVFTACERDAPQPPDTTEVSGNNSVFFDGYRILRSDTGSETEIKAAQLLRKVIDETFGVAPALDTDWIKRGETMPETGREILVGKTNRPESLSVAAKLKYDDYAIYKDSDRIVILGGSDGATQIAVEKFISLYIKPEDGGLKIPDKIDEIFKYDYPVSDIEVNGVSLAEYTIIYGSGNAWDERTAAEKVRDSLRTACGIELEVKPDTYKSDSGYEILLGSTDRTETKNVGSLLQDQEYTIKADGKKLIITGADKTGFIYGIMRFTDKYLSASGKVEFNDSESEKGKTEYRTAAFYVDGQNGADENNGSKSAPFKTVKHTIETAQKLAADAPHNISVYLSGGNHTITETLEIDGSVFGVSLSTLKFMPASAGEKPVITAAIPISGFKVASANGITVWEAELPKTLSSDGKTAYIDSHQAFRADGDRLSRPRLPESGFYYVAGVPGVEKPFSAERTKKMSAMNFNAGEIGTLSNPDDIQIRMFHYWTDEMIEIEDINTDSNTINFKSPSIFSLRQESNTTTGARYYLDNVFEALDAPGEFYMAKSEGKLYYVPEKGEDIKNAVIYLSGTDTILNISNWRGAYENDNIIFQDVTFADSDWKKTTRTSSQAAADINSAINLTNSTGITFDGCTFTRIGNNAVSVQTGCSGISFGHCTFFDLGAGAININGVNSNPVDPNVTIHDIRITDCNIEGYGKVYFNAVGILLRYAYDCVISHNEIHDGYYTGISAGWVWGYGYHVTNNIAIEYNHIYDIGKGLLSDMGGIYTLGTHPGTVIRNNLIHDIEMNSYGGWAIYPDEGSSELLIEKNICYNTTAQPFHQHYGANNMVRNNIFAFGDGGQVIITKKESHISIMLEHNIIVSDGTAIYAKSPGEMNFTDDSNLIWDYAGSASSGAMKYDANTKTYTFPTENRLDAEYMKARGLYKNVIVADPMFADPRNGDFTLSENSPAWSFGFEPIDMNEVGIRPR